MNISIPEYAWEANLIIDNCMEYAHKHNTQPQKASVQGKYLGLSWNQSKVKCILLAVCES